MFWRHVHSPQGSEHLYPQFHNENLQKWQRNRAERMWNLSFLVRSGYIKRKYWKRQDIHFRAGRPQSWTQTALPHTPHKRNTRRYSRPGLAAAQRGPESFARTPASIWSKGAPRGLESSQPRGIRESLSVAYRVLRTVYVRWHYLIAHTDLSIACGWRRCGRTSRLTQHVLSPRGHALPKELSLPCSQPVPSRDKVLCIS